MLKRWYIVVSHLLAQLEGIASKQQVQASLLLHDCNVNVKIAGTRCADCRQARTRAPSVSKEWQEEGIPLRAKS